MNYTILIADDSPSYRQMIKEIFNIFDKNYILLFANDGKEACEIAFSEQPDLILMDVIMPELNGIEAVKKLKSDSVTADIPVIVLSATESLISVFQAGANDFISKPFKQYELLIKVRSAINLVQKIKEIEKQKKELEEKHNEVSKQRDLIVQQKMDIIDDIKYSKRIQSAILPNKEYIDTIISNYFILDIPKNIVSGDFYWFGKKNNRKIIVAADCTGHGISGAFMTMAGIAFLNEIVNKYPFNSSYEILNYLREQVMKLLQQKGKEGEAADGMDISLCIIDPEKRLIQYSGANNPVYLVTYNELLEFKADRMPIGIHTHYDKPFGCHEIYYSKGDVLYLFTDGYADQFGGPLGKKYRHKQFHDLIFDNYRKPMTEQKSILLKTFNNWKGQEEQVDDILVIGINLDF